MNFHQTTEEIIKNATAEQRILWNYLFLKFGEKIGITQFYSADVIAGSEFLTYSANKMYLGLNIKFGCVPLWVAANGRVDFYDSTNNNNLVLSNPTSYWDATAVLMKQSVFSLLLENILFSRIVTSNYTFINFIGYRVSI